MLALLRPGGALLTGFVNPWVYLFEADGFDRGELRVANKLPVREERDGLIQLSHTFDEQLGGQLRAGLMITDMFEDSWPDWPALHGIAPAFMAIRAIKRARESNET
jgi:hypothetical protein